MDDTLPKGLSLYEITKDDTSLQLQQLNKMLDELEMGVKNLPLCNIQSHLSGAVYQHLSALRDTLHQLELFYQFIGRHDEYVSGEEFLAEGYFAVLPEEVFLQIAGCLSESELGVACMVSRRWYRIAADDQIWKTHYIIRWGSLPYHTFNLTSSVYMDTASKKKGIKSTSDKNKGSKLESTLSKSNELHMRPSWRGARTLFNTGYSITPTRSSSSSSSSSSSNTKTDIETSRKERQRMTKSTTIGGWKHQFRIKKQVEARWRSGMFLRVDTLNLHQGSVLCLDYHRNTLVSGSADETIQVYNLSKKTQLRINKAHRYTVKCIQLVGGEDGGRERGVNDNHMVSGGGTRDRMVKAWDVTMGKRIECYRAHEGGVFSLAATPSTIVSGGTDHLLKLWDRRVNPNNSSSSSSSCAVRVLRGHSDNIYAVQYLPSRHLIVSGAGATDKTVKLWDTRTWKEITSLKGGSGGIYSMHLRGNTLVTGSKRDVSVWDVGSRGEGRVMKSFEAHGSWVMGLQQDHTKLVTAGYDTNNIVKIWDKNTLCLLATLTGHKQSIRCLKFDDDKVVTGSSDTTIRIWHFGGEGRAHNNGIREEQKDIVQYSSPSRSRRHSVTSNKKRIQQSL